MGLFFFNQYSVELFIKIKTMNLGLQNQLFVVTGASSGLGRAVAENLLHEGAKVIVVGRRAELLKSLEDSFPGRVESFSTDLTSPGFSEALVKQIGNRNLDGILVNGGGPPAKAALETKIEEWDNAYNLILRWKVEMMLVLTPLFKKNQYGRILFIESTSVKQPIENLVLSTSLRLAVVGFAKTLSQELAHDGITVNVIAPGSHDTKALERLFIRKSEDMDISVAEAKKIFEHAIPVKRLGRPTEFASLATFLLSPISGFITGQTISVDGGAGKGIFG